MTRVSDSPEERSEEVSSLTQARMVEINAQYIAQAYNWRLIAVLEAAALVLAIVVLVYVVGQDRFVPYVIAIGKNGATLSVRPARSPSTIDESIVRAQITNFLVNARSIVTDPVTQQHYMDVAKGMTTGSAHWYLWSWYASAYPLGRMAQGTVQVQVTAIIPIGPLAFEVPWTETMRDPLGKVTGTQVWEATIKATFLPQSDEGAILRNPLGFYITSLDWTKKL